MTPALMLAKKCGAIEIPINKGAWVISAQNIEAFYLAAQEAASGYVLVPKDLIAAAQNLVSVKGRHHTELAYKQLCQSLVNAAAAPAPTLERDSDG